MIHTTNHVLVACYVAATLFILLLTQGQPHIFLFLGFLGQVLLFHLSYHIYKSQQIWYSFYLYALLCVVYILSFTNTDMFFSFQNPRNFTGKSDKDIRKRFMDFVHLNLCTMSTMGYSDIIPYTTIARTYSSYKIAVAIFMIVFLVSDINIKTR